MHKKMIKDANLDCLKDFLESHLGMLHGTYPELYEQAKNSLYEHIYGFHFNEWMLECAVSKMKNDDGTTGAHWTIEETNLALRNTNVKLGEYNQYDWNYVMNMLYSDYYKLIGDDTSQYVKMANLFINDTDSPSGKAYKYYIAMR